MAALALQDVSKKITRADILICILITILASFALFLVFMPGGAGKKVIVEIDGEIYSTFDINEPKKEIEIRTKYGYNIISVGGGEVSVKDADCPDKLDVKRGSIKRAGEDIICLPNHLRIYIEGEGKTDTVSY